MRMHKSSSIGFVSLPPACSPAVPFFIWGRLSASFQATPLQWTEKTLRRLWTSITEANKIGYEHMLNFPNDMNYNIGAK